MQVTIDPNAICIFYRVYEDGTRKPFGTGFFFMENDLVATAKHIMEDHANARTPYGLLVRPSQSPIGYSASECVYHMEQDLALVRLEKSHPVAPLAPCFETKEGFVFVGYDPPTESILARPVPKFFTPEPREGKLSTTFFFEWDGTVNPGSSGGPLIGSDGGVAGLLSGIPQEVEATDTRPQGGARARAVFVGPLLDLYLQLKAEPDSITRIHVPFT